METRASHLLIGGFVLVFVVGLFGFAIWLARIEIDREFAYYDIYFTGSVAGLGVGGDVRYRGIKVGTVVDIAINPDDPSRVGVTVQIGSDTPIREGDRASLQLQGITGVAFVNLKGATADRPPIVARAGEPWPVIPSTPSQIEKLFQGAPELINRGITLTERAAELFDAENQRLLTEILADVSLLAASLVSRRDKIERIVDAFDASSGDVAAAAREIRELSAKLNRLADDAGPTMAAARAVLEGADELMRDDLDELMADLRKMTRSVGRLAVAAEGVLTENREPLRIFSAEGLSEFSRFVTEARLLVAGLSRVTERLETDGARFLFGEREAEFKAQ